MKIIPLKEEHYPEVAEIYKEGLETGIATFETLLPDWEAWNNKFLPEGRFIAEVDGDIAGWCALSPTSERKVYQGVAEDTIYVSHRFQGQGIGKKLLLHLIETSEILGIWTLQAAIFPQNVVSIQLHKDCGFRVLGVREKVAQRNGTWYDNVLMERRSKKIK
jgi:phosphinothricin acetyltransferase